MTILELSSLAKRFGGNVVTDNVSLKLGLAELHAIIGPNGAGKTTLISQIAGELPPDGGKIQLNGEDITRLPSYMRARRGLARSFQISNIFQTMSAEDNVALSIQAQTGHSFKLWRDANTVAELREPAGDALKRVGLYERRDTPVAFLAHGERRQLELAMAVACSPQVILLDEPMAGLGAAESAEMIALIRDLKKSHGILLVEHDMDAVFSLADQISVLVAGRIIASGSPGAVKKNPVVRAAYLGTEADNPVVANGSATTQVVPARRSCPQGAVASKAGKVDAASAERCPAERFLMVEHVDAGYGPSQVLFDLTLNLGKGEVVALLGRNGMGKSTLLKLIGGAIKPIRGRIFFGAQEVTAMPLHSVVRLGIGVVPEGRHIFPSLTVEENLVATAIKRGHESTWNLRRIYELFPRLEERRGNMGNMLSGGEQQMLAIGRALMTNPKLLILDEATEGLAPLICAEIWKVIARLKASGQSIMIVDKDITALARLADRFHLLEKGRFIWSGKPAELDDNIEFVRRHMSI